MATRGRRHGKSIWTLWHPEFPCRSIGWATKVYRFPRVCFGGAREGWRTDLPLCPPVSSEAMKGSIMSFWSNFEGFFAAAEKAYTTISPEIGPTIKLAEEGASVVETVFPSTAPVITTVELAANSVAAVAPEAISKASTLIADGRAAFAALGPSLAAAAAALEGLFHATPAPGGTIILTPKTSAATVPAGSPSTPSA